MHTYTHIFRNGNRVTVYVKKDIFWIDWLRLPEWHEIEDDYRLFIRYAVGEIGPGVKIASYVTMIGKQL